MKPHRQAAWTVYVLRCGEGMLCTGVTTDLTRRLLELIAAGRLAP